MRLSPAPALALALIPALAHPLPAAAQEFVPETLTVKERIDPGPNVLVVDQGWDAASNVNVLSADDLTRKGNFSAGLNAQLALTRDRATAYVASVYMKRLVSGPIEAVLQEYDVATLTQKREIPISDKMAMVAPFKSYLALSADETHAFVQNATPATSVSVVDLGAGREIAEVPTPGCFSIYPAATGIAFSTLCGDGTVQKFTVGADGTVSAPATSEPIFDADADALFTHGERVGEDLVFVSFGGSVYRIADGGETPALVERFSFVEGIEGGWRPGGVEVLAYDPTHDVMFVTMHEGGEEGSHKNPAGEVWAVRLGDRALLYRSAVEAPVSIAVMAGETPVLFALDDENGAMTRYEIDPAAKFAAKPTGKAEELGDFAPLVIAP